MRDAPVPEDADILGKAAEARQKDFVESFKNYGMLLGTMDPMEFAAEIGLIFPIPKQAAIVAVLLQKILELERNGKK